GYRHHTARCILSPDHWRWWPRGSSRVSIAGQPDGFDLRDEDAISSQSASGFFATVLPRCPFSSWGAYGMILNEEELDLYAYGMRTAIIQVSCPIGTFGCRRMGITIAMATPINGSARLKRCAPCHLLL